MLRGGLILCLGALSWPTAAHAFDPSIPGRLEFVAEPPVDDFHPSIVDTIGVDSPGTDGYFVTYTPRADGKSGSINCIPRSTRERVSIWQSGQPNGHFNLPTVSANGNTIYSDERMFFGGNHNNNANIVFDRFRCNDRQPLPANQPGTFVETTRIVAESDAAFTALQPRPQPQGPLIGWEERVCVVTAAAIGCAVLDDLEPKIRIWATANAVAAGLRHSRQFSDPSLWEVLGVDSIEQGEFPNGSPLDRFSWSFGPAMAMANGHVVTIIKGEGSLPVEIAYLVELATDGQVERVLYGPSARWRFDSSQQRFQAISRRHPLFGVESLSYHRGWDAVVAFPIYDWDWTTQKSVTSGGAGNGEGFSGVGALLVPLSREGIGYLPLSAAVVDTPYPRAEGPGSNPYANQVPRGRSFVPIGENEAIVRFDRPTPRPLLRWDPPALDLDQDGLNAAEEAALGSSDWLWDSDGDGVADGVEAAAGLDPARDEGQRSAQVFDRASAGFAQSPWLKEWRLPTMKQAYANEHSVSANPGTQGPFCVETTCYFPDGRTLALPYAPETISIDGRWAIGPGGALRTNLQTGATTPWLREPTERLPGSQWIVESGESAYHYLPEALWHYDKEGRGRVVFDARSYRDPRPGSRFPLAHRGLITFSLVGYHAETKRVLLGGVGAWDAWTIGVDASTAPVLMERAQGMARQNRHVEQGALYTPWWELFQGSFPNRYPFPTVLQPNGHGVYFGDRWVYGAYLDDGAVGSFQDYIGANLLTQQSLVGGWNDVVVDRKSGDELVTIERKVEPGDVLLVDQRMLYRVGPRGGITALWSEPFHDLPQGAFAVSPSGRACFVQVPNNRTECIDGCFWELSPTDDDRVPIRRTASLTGRDFIDCAYEDDDTILFAVGLRNGNVQLERWRRGQTTTEPVGEPFAHSGVPTRQHFIDHPDGPRLEPFDANTGQPIEAWLNDGRVVRFRNNASDDAFRARMVTDGALEPRGGTPVVTDAVVNANGIVIINTSRGAVAWHPDLDHFTRVVTWGGEFKPTGLARVPGGVAHDPWTGDRLDNGVFGLSGDNHLSPLGPDNVLPANAQALESEGGCGGCGSGDDTEVAILFPLVFGPWWLLRKRRAAN